MDEFRHVINVTEGDVHEGVRGTSAHCVVAAAIGRTVAEALRIHVDAKSISFSFRGRRLTYRTPEQVAEYVRAFDAGDFSKVKPMALTLEHPDVSKPKRHGGGTDYHRRRTRKRVEPPKKQDRTWGLRILQRQGQLDICPECRNYKKPAKDARCAICASGRGDRVSIGMVGESFQ